MDFTLFIGISGAFLILFAFIMLQTHRWKDTDLMYDVINAAGSILLLIYGILLGTYPFVVLNAVWALVSLKDVYTDILSIKKIK